MLESFFLDLTNTPHIQQVAEQRWRNAFTFTRNICERISRTSTTSLKFDEVRLRLERMDRMYGQLRVKRKTRATIIRAIPSLVLHPLYDAVNPDPNNDKNPFKNESSRWRAFIVFILLLHVGLRRGETLSLPYDFLKSERSDDGKRKYWINVRNNEYEEIDPRHSIPSIKTLASIRQIPVSTEIANLLEIYRDNYRGKQNHSFYLSSAKNRPLSAEAIDYFFKKLTSVLSQETLKVLRDRTGMNTISAHDLRHTAAVIRLNQFLDSGDEMSVALQKLRSYFGWAHNSTMPLLYSKAVFHERLQNNWSNIFDNRVLMLSKAPQ
ncbi:MAG: site-specific integrase [Gammaproteobacteria bacterium]|nr:site-specific integrase [Gammaproteobacteria bacterium]